MYLTGKVSLSQNGPTKLEVWIFDVSLQFLYFILPCKTPHIGGDIKKKIQLQRITYLLLCPVEVLYGLNNLNINVVFEFVWMKIPSLGCP